MLDHREEPVPFELDGREVTAAPGETIWQVARRHGIAIPHLCYAPQPGYRPDGNCRACMVEVQGERVLVASCIRRPAPGMRVVTNSTRAESARALVMELLLADQPARAAAHDPDSALWRWADRMGVASSRFPSRPASAPDRSHPAMAVHLDACIHCGLCVRACREVQVNDVIGMAHRNHHAKVVFDFDDPMGRSTCVACGECVQACPTGALMPASVLDERGVKAHEADRRVDSLCPYCGVGCQVTYHIESARASSAVPEDRALVPTPCVPGDDAERRRRHSHAERGNEGPSSAVAPQMRGDRILHVGGRDGPANHNRLCVKGRFGFDYIHHPQRLTTPLIRKPGVTKDADDQVDPAARSPISARRPGGGARLRRRGLMRIREAHGPRALAGFGSAKGSNEEAYLFQKLVRTGFGCNNVDHCTRLCHASSVAALMETIGSGAVTAPFAECLHSDVIVVIGANPTVNHPVAATFIKNAAKRGAALIVIDPRGQTLSRHATHRLQFRPGTDVALLNALLNVIITEELYDRDYVAQYTEGFEALRRSIADFTPEAMAPLCGTSAETLREVARVYARAKAALIFWGMGISQHVHGTDNARCLIALALLTGNVGRPGAGLHPLRGQNNVQGASDAGLIPMVYPDYRPVGDADTRRFYEGLWGMSLDPEPGLTVVEIMHAVHRGAIRGMYIMGENPAMSDPDVHHARGALAKLEHLVVQEIFLTGDGVPRRRHPAGDDLPREDRHLHQHRPPRPARPPGAHTPRRGPPGLVDHPGARAAAWGILGEYTPPARRLRRTAPVHAGCCAGSPGIAWSARGGDVPLRRRGRARREVIFGAGFPTPTAGKSRPADVLPPDETPDASYRWC
jgi:formate dehydrogenase major subunit